MKAVIDTNIIVSGLLDAFSCPGEIVRMIASNKLKLCYDIRILMEYREVLLRSKFSFLPSDVNDLLVQIETCGFYVSSEPLKKRLPDHDDEPFLEVAITGKAEYLVTGNLKHYSVKKLFDVSIISPSEFLAIYRKKTIPSNSQTI